MNMVMTLVWYPWTEGERGPASALGLEPAEVGQHLIGMLWDVADAERLADHAVRVDQVRPSLRVLGTRLLGVALGVVDGADGPVHVGQHGEPEPLLPRELG